MKQEQLERMSPDTREYFGKISHNLAHYQPLIEQRVSELAGTSGFSDKPITLGDVQIKDTDELVQDKLQHLYDLAENWVQKTLYYIFCLERRASYKRDSEFFKSNGLLYYFDQSIYAPFQATTENPGLQSRLNEKPDQDAVHELSHCLWVKLGGEHFFSPLFSLEYTEGYASYCEKIWFFDFYPHKTRTRIRNELKNPPHNAQTLGRKRIEELVSQHGQQILLHIPSKWQELEKTLTAQ